MLKRAESFGIRRLVRKSSVGGRAAPKSSCSVDSGVSFFFDGFKLKGEELDEPPSSSPKVSFTSLAFLFLRNRFILDSKLSGLFG
jgi:hypothetical protein